VTRRSASSRTGIAQTTSFGAAIVAPIDVQPLRTLAEFARSIFDAARDLMEDRGDLVET